MVLDEFHIFEWYASLVRHGHSITCFYGTIGSERENSSCTTSAHYYRFTSDRLHFTGAKFDCNYSLASVIINKNLCSKPFIITGNIVVLERCLKKSVEHMETGFICSKPCTLNFHTSKRSSCHCPISFPTPRTTPMFHLNQFLRSVVHKKFHRILITHPVSSSNGIIDMVFHRIVIFDNSSRSALSRHSMAPHGVYLTYHCDAQVWVRFGNGNSRSKSCATTAHHDNIVFCDHLNFSRRIRVRKIISLVLHKTEFTKYNSFHSSTA